MYLAVLARPDIAFSVCFLSQFNNSFTETHWKSGKRVLKYLHGTQDLGLVFKRTDVDLEGHVDADWASNKQDRKSYTGFVFVLSGGAISWESRRQWLSRAQRPNVWRLLRLQRRQSILKICYVN